MKHSSLYSWWHLIELSCDIDLVILALENQYTSTFYIQVALLMTDISKDTNQNIKCAQDYFLWRENLLPDSSKTIMPLCIFPWSSLACCHIALSVNKRGKIRSLVHEWKGTTENKVQRITIKSIATISSCHLTNTALEQSVDDIMC